MINRGVTEVYGFPAIRVPIYITSYMGHGLVPASAPGLSLDQFYAITSPSPRLVLDCPRPRLVLDGPRLVLI